MGGAAWRTGWHRAQRRCRRSWPAAGESASRLRRRSPWTTWPPATPPDVGRLLEGRGGSLATAVVMATRETECAAHLEAGVGRARPPAGRWAPAAGPRAPAAPGPPAAATAAHLWTGPPPWSSGESTPRQSPGSPAARSSDQKLIDP